MHESAPSRTALRVAMRRAAHQLFDDPVVFADPLALRVLTGDEAAAVRSDPKWTERTSYALGLRAFLAARGRLAEEELKEAVERGVGQCVVLGAGLDTLALRSPYGPALRIFEVDHPATQAWKRERLEAAGIEMPPWLVFAPVDFESGTLRDGLAQAGFDFGRPAFFSWLGVTQYLTADAVLSTLALAGSLPPGGGLVFDYAIDPRLLQGRTRLAYEALAARVAAAGEPFSGGFDPALLAARLRESGFTHVQDLDAEALNARCFARRADGLSVRGFSRLMLARR